MKIATQHLLTAMKTEFNEGIQIRRVPTATFKIFYCIVLGMAIIGAIAGVNTANLMIEVGVL